MELNEKDRVCGYCNGKKTQMYQGNLIDCTWCDGTGKPIMADEKNNERGIEQAKRFLLEWDKQNNIPCEEASWK